MPAKKKNEDRNTIIFLSNLMYKPFMMHHHDLCQKVHLGDFEISVSYKAACSQFSFMTNLR